MSKRIETSRIHHRKWKLTLTVLFFIFSLISVSAAFSEKDPWIVSVEKGGESVIFADHSESLTEGGWILLSGGKEIQLPQPFNFSYQGASTLKKGGVTVEIKPEAGSENTSKLAFTYPYPTHPFYTENQKVTMDFNGPKAFKKQPVNIYLVKGLNVRCTAEILKNITDCEGITLKEAFNKSTGSYTKMSATLDKNGDLPEPITFDSLEPGSYGILITLDDEENKKDNSGTTKKVLSATGFEVVNYDLTTDAADTLKEGEDLEVDLSLKGAPANGEYTYGAVLIKEEAYKAEINFTSNGTKAGTDVYINDIGVVRDLCFNSTNFKSKFTKSEVTKDIQTLIGEGNGTISIGEKNQDTLCLTTLDLLPGDYLLFTGAYEKGKGLVGIDQEELKIK